MRKETIEFIKLKFKRDFSDINYEIRKNKKEINRLAEQQITLKESRKKLWELLRQIK